MVIDNKVLVFVYGTLKVGGYYAERFDEYRVDIDKGTIKGEMFQTAHFPLIIEGNGLIHGELHEYTSPRIVIEMMDQIEGYIEGSDDNFYERRTVEVTIENGDKYYAFAYFAVAKSLIKGCENGEYRKIETGKWV